MKAELCKECQGYLPHFYETDNYLYVFCRHCKASVSKTQDMYRAIRHTWKCPATVKRQPCSCVEKK